MCAYGTRVLYPGSTKRYLPASWTKQVVTSKNKQTNNNSTSKAVFQKQRLTYLTKRRTWVCFDTLLGPLVVSIKYFHGINEVVCELRALELVRHIAKELSLLVHPTHKHITHHTVAVRIHPFVHFYHVQNLDEGDVTTVCQLNEIDGAETFRIKTEVECLVPYLIGQGRSQTIGNWESAMQ